MKSEACGYIERHFANGRRTLHVECIVAVVRPRAPRVLKEESCVKILSGPLPVQSLSVGVFDCQRLKRE